MISNGASPGGLAVSQAADEDGTLVLAGANSYSGGTTVDSGATVSTSSISALGSGGLTNNGTVLVSSGTLELKGAVTGTGTDKISGDSTLEFDAGVSSAKTRGDQDIVFTGGGTLHLFAPQELLRRDVRLRDGRHARTPGPWAFSGISHAGGVTTLTLASGSTTHAFEFVGDYTRSEFHITPGTTTNITYA